uniref:Uncharacterized protein n=1 Tax=Leersia perrieri TaxID=77586 RepID=A0A0D9WU79_9ORYZ
MRSSSSPSLAKSIFSLGTQATMIERSNSTPSSTPARPPRSPLGVDEEYDQAFRSKSFLDLWSHAHRHLSHTLSSFKLPCNGDDGGGGETEQSCSYTVLDDFVLEPSPELRRPRRHRRRRGGHRVETLLVEYFDVTEAACAACSALLAAVGAARRHHLTLRRLLLRLDGDGDGEARNALARHVRLDNPLSSGSLAAGHGERPLMEEVAREEEECEEDLRAQLAELEEHLCLCLITINRTRRLVAHEMTRGSPPSSEKTMTTTATATAAAGD